MLPPTPSCRGEAALLFQTDRASLLGWVELAPLLWLPTLRPSPPHALPLPRGPP